jgi:NagD protein
MKGEAAGRAAGRADGGSFDRTLGTKRVAFLDLDGTIYHGDSVVPGAPEFVSALSARDVATYFLSNNSSRSKRAYVEKLGRMDIPADERRIVLSTDGCAEHLVGEGLTRVYAVGTRSFREELARYGVETGTAEVDAVVLGYDTEATYERLARAAILIGRGLPYFATHPDRTCPSPEGPLPDAGAFAAMFETATGRRPDRVFGKPDASMVEGVLERERARPADCFMVGDRLYTDFALARNVGCEFVCVLTGETTREDIERLSGRAGGSVNEPDGVPDLVVESVAQIIS